MHLDARNWPCKMAAVPQASIPQLVLASASPRRSELLRNAGFHFTVHPAHVDESMLPGEQPLEHATRLAREKARAIRQQYPDDFVLGADTIVVVENQVLSKPRDAADATRMLGLLSGRSHRVITGVCLTGSQPSGKNFEEVRAETTEVFVRTLSAEEIAAYIASGEPMDKAGAYAIQGRASRWIPKIVGCYFNVVGLPVPLVSRMLREHGFDSELAG